MHACDQIRGEGTRAAGECASRASTPAAARTILHRPWTESPRLSLCGRYATSALDVRGKLTVRRSGPVSAGHPCPSRSDGATVAVGFNPRLGTGCRNTMNTQATWVALILSCDFSNEVDGSPQRYGLGPLASSLRRAVSGWGIAGRVRMTGGAVRLRPVIRAWALVCVSE